jgi:predicted extracellular nuclease
MVMRLPGSRPLLPTLLALGFFLMSGRLANQPADCGGLFFSEYIEGSSYNKALEIYNGSGGAIDLSAAGYAVRIYFNGSASPGLTIPLNGWLEPGDVFVLAQSSADPAILAQADQVNGASWFNGDDAIELTSGSATIDVIGQIGYDPGNQWGSGFASTQDNTLRRQAAISAGDGDGTDPFDPATEWDGFPNDTFDGLGQHAPTCGPAEAAPYITSADPAAGGMDVPLDSQLLIRFSEAVNLAQPWFDLTCTVSGAHPSAVSGGPKNYRLDPAIDFSPQESCTFTVFAAAVTDLDEIDPPDQMISEAAWSFTTAAAPGDCSSIPLIQGSGASSPCLGYLASILGCLTGVTADGFYFQDPSGDGDPASSDGMYVYMGSSWTNPSGWQPGDLASVSGTVIEYYDTTEFQSGSAVAIVPGGCALPAAVSIAPISDPNADPVALYERFEGMRVAMSLAGWVVGPTRRFASRFAGGDPEIAFIDFSSTIPAHSRIFESDFPGYQGLNYLSGGFDKDLPDLDFGDEITATLTGVLGYRFGKYTLLTDLPDPQADIDSLDLPDVTNEQAPAQADKLEFDICYYNVENLFDHLDDGQGDWGDWAPGFPTPGTQAGAAAYLAHLAETAAVLVQEARGCWVIGLEEVEGKQQVYDDLAAALHALDPEHIWRAAYVESGGERDLSQGFLWREAVSLLGSLEPVNGEPFQSWVSDGTLDFVRAPALGLFRFFAGSAAQVDLHLAAVHFKSKRSDPACSTPDCTDRREKEAADLRDILAHFQEQGEYGLAGGDFNDFLGSSPLDVLETDPRLSGLYSDLPADTRYSYIFNGESSAYDHLYLTHNLLAASGSNWGHLFTPVHVNADFPSRAQASDHDPLRILFHFFIDDGAGNPGADFSDLPLSYDLAWQRAPHALFLGDAVDDEADFSPGADDPSDTGVARLPGDWRPGRSVTVRASVSGGSGWLSAWFDWDRDGAFSAAELTIDGLVSPGINDFAFAIPSAARLGQDFETELAARFRLYEAAPENPQPVGGAPGGEVEDYLWRLGPTAVGLVIYQAIVSGNAWLGWCGLGLAALGWLAVPAARKRR